MIIRCNNHKLCVMIASAAKAHRTSERSDSRPGTRPGKNPPSCILLLLLSSCYPLFVGSCYYVRYRYYYMIVSMFHYHCYCYYYDCYYYCCCCSCFIVCYVHYSFFNPSLPALPPPCRILTSRLLRQDVGVQEAY